MTNFTIDVVSDTVCPWCYIGRKQLQEAQQLWLARHPDSKDTFTIKYSPYQLNPHWPKGPASSTDKQEYYRAKFGAAQAERVLDRITQAGSVNGIKFKFGGRTGNSRDSHRLVRLARGYGPETENKTIDLLFAGFLEQEKDITDYDTLRSVAAAAGISDVDFQRAIVDSDEGGAEVDEAVAGARTSGVTGVPSYVIQDRFRVSGAGDPSTFVNTFENVKRLEEAVN